MYFNRLTQTKFLILAWTAWTASAASFLFLSSTHHITSFTTMRRIVGGRSGAAADAAAADIRMHSRMLASLRYHRLLLACERPCCVVRHDAT